MHEAGQKWGPYQDELQPAMQGHYVASLTSHWQSVFTRAPGPPWSPPFPPNTQAPFLLQLCSCSGKLLFEHLELGLQSLPNLHMVRDFCSSLAQLILDTAEAVLGQQHLLLLLCKFLGWKKMEDKG